MAVVYNYRERKACEQRSLAKRRALLFNGRKLYGLWHRGDRCQLYQTGWFWCSPSRESAGQAIAQRRLVIWNEKFDRKTEPGRVPGFVIYKPENSYSYTYDRLNRPMSVVCADRCPKTLSSDRLCL
jgi:hypothetical protein